MAFKLRGTGTNVGKKYLFPKALDAPYGREFIYVSADTPATVDGSGYITAATGEDHQLAIDMLKVGDLIWHYQVAAIDDDREIADDMEAGITDISLHAVLVNSGEIIDLSDDLLGGQTFAGVLTYGD